MGESLRHKYCNCGDCIAPYYCEHCDRMYCEKCLKEHKEFLKNLVENRRRNAWQHCYLHIQCICNDYKNCGKLSKCAEAKKVVDKDLKDSYNIKLED